jgi:DNA polymerase III delta prime subunit
MILNKLIGQEKIWERLVTAYENDHIAGAYLFHGPSGVGKEGTAYAFPDWLIARQREVLFVENVHRVQSLTHYSIPI